MFIKRFNYKLLREILDEFRCIPCDQNARNVDFLINNIVNIITYNYAISKFKILTHEMVVQCHVETRFDEF